MLSAILGQNLKRWQFPKVKERRWKEIQQSLDRTQTDFLFISVSFSLLPSLFHVIVISFNLKKKLSLCTFKSHVQTLLLISFFIFFYLPGKSVEELSIKKKLLHYYFSNIPAEFGDNPSGMPACIVKISVHNMRCNLIWNCNLMFYLACLLNKQARQTTTACWEKHEAPVIS